MNPAAAMEGPQKTDGRLASSILKRSSKGSDGKGAKSNRGTPVTERGSQEILNSAVSEHEQIALLAYSYWEARGGQGGSPEEDWYRAEREFYSGRERAAKVT